MNMTGKELQLLAYSEDARKLRQCYTRQDFVQLKGAESRCICSKRL